MSLVAKKIFLGTNSVHFLTEILLSYMCIFVHIRTLFPALTLWPRQIPHTTNSDFPYIFCRKNRQFIAIPTMAHWISSIEQKASYGCFPVYAKQITTHVFPSFFTDIKFRSCHREHLPALPPKMLYAKLCVVWAGFGVNHIRAKHGLLQWVGGNNHYRV